MHHRDSLQSFPHRQTIHWQQLGPSQSDPFRCPSCDCSTAFENIAFPSYSNPWKPARKMRPVFVPVRTYAVFGKPAQSTSSIHVLRSVNVFKQRRLSIWDELRRPCQYINDYFTAGCSPQGLYRTRRYMLSIVQILHDLATIDSGGRGRLEKLDHAHGLRDLVENCMGMMQEPSIMVSRHFQAPLVIVGGHFQHTRCWAGYDD